ncbi:MAG: GNAT family N-acetyltransferase [Peptoniphilaceae bacterium]|nr:GNAT family N-acetyltransferase [Peptoniphilaceae bacterium]
MKKLVTQTENLYIKTLELSDAYLLKKWGQFNDPYLLGYNYSNLSDFEIEFWYKTIKIPTKNYFSVFTKEDNNFIGFIGIKEIKYFRKTSKLGIVFDPNFVSKGFGYEAMKSFLSVYFFDYNFREMTLDVNLFNTRAMKLYKKLGFEVYGKSNEIFENQDVEFDERYFLYKYGKIYSKLLKMRIRR